VLPTIDVRDVLVAKPGEVIDDQPHSSVVSSAHDVDAVRGHSTPDQKSRPATSKGPSHEVQDIFTSIELAALLGVKRVVTMSGAPGSEPDSTLPVWNVVPWHSAFLRIQDYQWNEVAIPFWKRCRPRKKDKSS
jgi:hypothetical protein